MKKVLVLAIIILTVCGCRMMEPTIAHQVIRLDKNLHTLLPDYRVMLEGRLEAAKTLPEGIAEDELEKVAHDLLLLDASLLLSEDMVKSAEMALKEEK